MTVLYIVIKDISGYKSKPFVPLKNPLIIPKIYVRPTLYIRSIINATINEHKNTNKRLNIFLFSYFRIGGIFGFMISEFIELIFRYPSVVKHNFLLLY